MVHLTKYFATAAVLILVFKHYVTLASAGEKLIPIIFIISITGILITSLWFNAVNEEKLVKYRIVWTSVNTWGEVDSVTPKIYREDPMSRTNNVNQFKPLKTHTEYHIQFKNGTTINARENLSSVYQLHKFVVENNVNVNYDNRKLQFFEQNYTSYFKKGMPKAKFIFYGIVGA